jgi:hypothetical protein
MKKIFDKVNKIFDTIKKSLDDFREWKKGDPREWQYKIAIIVLTILLLVVLYKVLVYIFCGLLIFTFYFGEWVENAINKRQSQNQQYSLLYNFEISKNALFKVLKEIAHIYDLVTPKSLSSIAPISYPSLQYINNLPFYRFIVLKSKGVQEYDFISLRENFNTLIAQKLIAFEIENVNQPCYQDIPCIYVLKVDDDSNNPDYVAIDIMYVDSTDKYNYACRIANNEHFQSENSYVEPPTDKDF